MGVALRVTAIYFSLTLKIDIFTEERSNEPIGTLDAVVRAKFPNILVEQLISSANADVGNLLIPMDLVPLPSWTLPLRDISLELPLCKYALSTELMLVSILDLV